MKLFTAFNKVSYEDWRKKIEIDLKGKDYQETLVWKSEEEIDVQPFYNRSVTPQISSLTKPNNNWEIRETINITDFTTANKRALLALKGGANSLCFIGDVNTQEDMDVLLKDIQTAIVNIHFCTPHLQKTANFFTPNNGSISFDFLGDLINSNNASNIEELANFTNNSNHLKTIVIKQTNLNSNNSPTIFKELACSISHGVEYLNLLSEKGINPELIANKMEFHFTIGNNYFFEIAKFRAARILWGNVLKQYGIINTNMFMHTETKQPNFNEEDIATNILRNTTKAMSAIIGGCDSLSIAPHDNKIESLDFSNRIARNIQHLLKEEAFFDKVNNPADGAYYIENLTKEICTKAWINFQKIEKNGGYLKAIENKIIDLSNDVICDA